MKPVVYVDTGFWIALFDARDVRHGHAKGIFREMIAGYEVVTSESVIGETVTYLNCSLKRNDLAVAFLNCMETAPIRHLVDGDAAREQARFCLRRYADIPLSYTDCMSFVLMRQHAVSRYAGYDRHFDMMGFLALQR